MRLRLQAVLTSLSTTAVIKTPPSLPSDNHSEHVAAMGAAEVVGDGLSDLLAQRFHGAVNIRGIRFQLQYAAWRIISMALEHVRAHGEHAASAEPPRRTVQIEGIEDVDVRNGPSLGPIHDDGEISGEFVQLKTAIKGWSWHQLAGPLKGFIELLRTGTPNVTCRLVTNFPFTGDLDLLARYRKLPPGEAKEIEGKFMRLCRKCGISEAEARKLLEGMWLESITGAELHRRLTDQLVALTDTADDEMLRALDSMVVGKCMEWAESRSVVNGIEVVSLLAGFQDAMARQQHHAAVYNRLVGRFEYRADASPEDFFDAKRVRFGHVFEGLDVKRPEMLERVHQALLAVGVCVIRAPSGHGKSTLAYRYVLDHWPPEHTVRVRSVASDEAAATISDYIHFRSHLGLPIRVYIDADSTTRLWPRVAEAARASGAQVLVTVRTEDWQRFAIESLSRLEVIEPTLGREEAARIFSVFKERNRVERSVDSANWAYERLSPPHLLLEFVYLITHGEMLQDRLRDQIHQFQSLNEDPAKTDILRLVSLASALGATVSTDRLLDEVQFREDPQATIQSLVGEFLTLDDGMLEGLHWVRSEHVARLLHQGGVVPVTRSVLRLASMVPSASLPFLVANAMQWDGIDRRLLLQGLVDRFADEATESVLLVMDGLFEAGERDFFEANRPILQDAYDLVGSGGVFLVGTAVAPVIAFDVTETMITLLGEKSGAFPRLKELIGMIRPAPRGLDLVREFLSPVVARSAVKHLRAADTCTGRILDWCAVAGVAIPGWDGIRDGLTVDPPFGTWTRDDLCWFSQGLFRVDHEAYLSWFARNRRDLLVCLQWHAECLSLVLREPSSVVSDGMLDPETIPRLPAVESDDTVERRDRDDEVARARADADANGRPIADVLLTFPAELGVGVSPHDQAVRRLDTLRAALPACGRYCSEGKYLIVPGFPLPYDDTQKRIFRWHLPLPSDVAKNVVWRVIAERAFLPDTLYRFQQHWYDIRILILEVTRGLSSVLKRGLRGKDLGADRAFGKDQELIKRFEDAVRALPNISGESLRVLARGIPPAPENTESAPSKYTTSFQTFRRQLWDYSHTHERQTGRLLMFNLRDAVDELAGLHGFFAHLFRYSPDYFGAHTLNDSEIRALSDLVLLVDASVKGQMVLSDRPLAELRERQRLEGQQRLARLTEAAGAIPGAILPTGFVEKRWERSTALAIPISDPQLAIGELVAASLALVDLHEEIDTVWLVPTYQGARLSSGGHSINLRAVSELAEEEDESKAAMFGLRLVVPQELPAEVEALLPELPVRAAATPPLFMRVAGIRPVIEMLVERRRAIEAIGEEEDHTCLMMLREKLAGGLVEFDTQVTEVVDTAAADLAALASAGVPEDGSVIADVAAFLDAARAALHSVRTGLEFLARWSAEDAESLAEALAQASKRSGRFHTSSH